jgi:hypothetical protein
VIKFCHLATKKEVANCPNDVFGKKNPNLLHFGEKFLELAIFKT